MNLTKIVSTLFCAAMCLSSCSDDNSPVVNENVPSEVLKSFAKQYGNVTDVKWEQKNDYHVARFNGGKLSRAAESAYTTSAWFTTDGKQRQADQDIDFKDLPAVVQDAFNAYKESLYADWTVDDCEVVVRDEMSQIYVVEIEKDELEREISISEEGAILKDVLDDDDDDDILPVVISDELKAALKLLFPETFDGIQYLELEIDDEEIEVDIIEGGKHKEIEFDAQYNWVSTEYDVTVEEAMELLKPEAVEKLKALAEKNGIDLTNPDVQKDIEIEVKDHFEKGLMMEIEIEIGDLDLEIIIDENGNIVNKD